MVHPSEIRFPRIGELSPFHQLLDVHGMDFAMVGSWEQRNEKQRQGVQFSEHTVCFLTIMVVPGEIIGPSRFAGAGSNALLRVRRCTMRVKIRCKVYPLDRVGSRRLRTVTLPHHRTCRFQHPAVEPSG